MTPEWGEIDSFEKDRIDKARLARDKETLEMEPPQDISTAELETLPNSLSDRHTQLLLRDFDHSRMMKALSGASGTVVLHFLKFMGDRGQILYLEDLTEARNKAHSLGEIAECQKALLTFLQSLE